MIAKLVIKKPTREHAIARTLRAPHEYKLYGVRTSLELLRWPLDAEPFRTVRLDTRYVERAWKAKLAAG